MSQTEALARAYLAAIGLRDFDLARTYLADRGFRYTSPIGSFLDADRFIQSISAIGPILERLDIRRFMAQGREAVAIVDVVITLNGYESHPSAMWFVVADDRINTIEALFDASDYHKMFSSDE